MLRITIIFLISGVLFLTACQNGTSQEQEGAAKTESQGPRLMKITIQTPAEADSLLAKGFDLIVIEDNYVVVRLEPADSTKIQATGVAPLPITEQELVQRLVKIPVTGREQVQALADIGMDIWQAHGDTVVAQVFDKHIREAEQQGFSVIIVEENVLNIVEEKKDD